MLLDPELGVLRAVSDLAQVAVDPLDQRVATVPQLTGHRVRGAGKTLVERLESRGAVGVAGGR